MKPDWKDAPEWANYMAADENNRWYWYEKKPVLDGDGWMNASGGKAMKARATVYDWTRSIQARP